MSWFSDEHKNLYSQALSALYDDVKIISTNAIDTSGKLMHTGYEKIKETVNYIDKKYHQDSSDDNDNSESDNEIDITDDTDDYILEVGKMFPDILIKLGKNRISKIWIIENDGTLKPVRGKIDSYEYISVLIHRWFVYTSNDNNYGWYPTDDLYTVYRESSSRLNNMDEIVFKYGYNGYKPYHYNPLL